MKAYKAFNRIGKKRKSGECRGVVFEEGKTYTLKGKPVLCENGYHFCKDLVLTFQYYSSNLDETVFAEVDVLGETDFEQPNKHKGCTNKIKIVRFMSKKEVKEMLDDSRNSGDSNSGYWNSGDSNSGYWNSGDSNSGDWNSGDSNSGYWNSGNRNSGDRNSGDSNSGDWNSGDSNSGNRNSGNRNSGNRNSGNRNSGDWNSGDSNSGDSNSGYWNSGNRNSGNRNSGNRNSGNRNSGDWNSGDWNSGNRNSGNRNSGDWNSCSNETGFFNSKEPTTINVFNKPCLKELWDKAAKPNFIYFLLDTELGYKGSFQKAFESATQKDIELLKALPNFDAQVFFEISGIKLEGYDYE